MTDREKEMIEHAKAIKQYCKDGGYCEECVFGEEDDDGVALCGLNAYGRFPYEWETE